MSDSDESGVTHTEISSPFLEYPSEAVYEGACRHLLECTTSLQSMYLDPGDSSTERRKLSRVEVQPEGSYQASCSRKESLGFYSRHQEAQEDRAAVRAEIEILRRERLAYEQESIETRQALARSKAYSRALEARIRVLETQAYHHE
ncbi:hypothetical protein Tco_0838269 [Tanacetum coccineum]|uniref:Uncharacterized protein n=1 Tax=Tanacetum coccineum TaxID=301880 RepID=A0ABQ5AQM3_9ASTR